MFISAQRHKASQGFLLLIGLFTLAGVGVLIANSMTQVLTEQRAVRIHVNGQKVFHLAEAGIDAVLWEYRHSDGNFLASEGWGDVAGEAPCPTGPCQKTILQNGTVTVLNPDGPTPTIQAQEDLGVSHERIEVVLERGQPSPFQQAIFTKGYMQVHVDADVDSYDSRLGAYNAAISPADPNYGSLNRSQVGLYSSWNADLRTNGTTSLSIYLAGNNTVFGDGIGGPGVDPTVVIPPGIYPVIYPNVGSVIRGDTFAAESNYLHPPVEIPPGSPQGTAIVPPCAGGSVVYSVSDFAETFAALTTEDCEITIQGDGIIHLDGVHVVGSGTLTLDGNITLVLHGVYHKWGRTDATFAVGRGSTLQVQGGTTRLYVMGRVYVNGLIDNVSKVPGRFMLSVQGPHYVRIDTLFNGEDPAFYAAIDAPDSQVQVTANPFYGSIIANESFTGATDLHFDEALRQASAQGTPGNGGSGNATVLSWRQLP